MALTPRSEQALNYTCIVHAVTSESNMRGLEVHDMEQDPNALEALLNKIIRRFDNDQHLLRSEAYPDGGTQVLMGRLGRAALNQATEGEATLSRYAVWANTARDHIAEALLLLDEDRAEAERLLRLAHNSLSAFAEIQALFDPINARAKRDK